MLKKRNAELLRGEILEAKWLCTKSRHYECLSLRSRRKHKAWGRQPQDNATQRFEPVKRATALGFRFRPLSRAGDSKPFSPGADAPGFMLSPASQAKTL
jgi:hypothetical protein